jgi:uncharacterized protein
VGVAVADNPGAQRFEAELDGAPAGYLAYRKSRRRGLTALIATEVDDEFSGKGIGGALVRHALDAARSEGLAVLPFCPFVNSYISEHRDEYLDLVPESHRPEFDL